MYPDSLLFADSRHRAVAAVIGLCVCALALLNGCATKSKARPASEYLYTTDKPTDRLLKEIQSKLEENKYVVKKNDSTSGILVTEARGFSFNSGSAKVNATQKVHIRQEGGSLKLRISYTCDYGRSAREQNCNTLDSATQDKINRIEKILIKELSPLFEKHQDEDEW